MGTDGCIAVIPLSPPLNSHSAGSVSPELSNWSFTSSETVPLPPFSYPTLCYMVAGKDGALTVTCAGTNGGTEPATTEWWPPNPVTDVGAGYDIRVTETSGTFSSGTVGTWIALSSDRTWMVNADNSTNTVSFTIEIRPTGGGSTLASASCTISITNTRA